MTTDRLQDRLRAAIDHFTSGGGGPRMDLLSEAADRIDELERELEQPMTWSAPTLPSTLIVEEIAVWLEGQAIAEDVEGFAPDADRFRNLATCIRQRFGTASEAQTQKHGPGRTACDPGHRAPEWRETDRDMGTGATGLLVDTATLKIIEAREGARYEWDPTRGWVRATLAEGTYIGPDPEGSGSRDSVQRATDTDEGPTG